MSDTVTNQEEQPTIPSVPAISCVPPYDFKRNEFGLLTHLNYHFDADGYVNWRKMVPNEFLVPDKAKTKETDITKLDDSQLLILLGGIKKLARIRGYTSIVHKPIVATPEYVAIATTITYIPNYETDGPLTFMALADAHVGNTTGFTKSFLCAIAENRGLTRAVRNALGINITGKEEVGSEGGVAACSQAGEILETLMEKNNIAFTNLQNRMTQKGIVGAETWESVADIPDDQIFEVIQLTQERLAEKKAKAAAKT